MKEFFKFIFSSIGLIYFWFPLAVVAVLIGMAIGKYSFCTDKYDGFKAFSCFFSDKARY